MRSEFILAGEILYLIRLRLENLFRKNPRTSAAYSGKVLIVDTCLIGDFLATIPALRQYIALSDRKVDLVVSPPVTSIAESIRGVHAVFAARSNYRRDIENEVPGEVPLDEYELVFALRVGRDAFRLLKHIRYFQLRTSDAHLLGYFAHLTWNIIRKADVRQWRKIVFDMLGIVEPRKPQLFEELFDIKRSEYERVEKLVEGNGTGKRMIIHTGSGWSVKLWDNQKWVKLITEINKMGEYKFIFVGAGETDANSFDLIRRNVDIEFHSLIHKVDLKTILLLMRLSDVFVGIDSGPRNLAHIAGLRSITMLGPAPHNLTPQDKDDIVIDKFTCRCKSFFYLHKVSAMARISVDEVLTAFKRLSLPTNFFVTPDGRLGNEEFQHPFEDVVLCANSK